MNCKICGNPLTLEDKFCKKCGTAVMKAGEEVSNAVNNTVNPEPMTLPSVEPVKVEASPVVNPTPVAPASPTPTPVTPAPMAGPTPAPAQPVPVAPAAMPAQPAQPNFVNPAPMAPPKAKTNPILLIVIALLAVAAGYFGYKALFANDGGSIVASATSKVNYNGYSFEVPKEYTTKISSEGLELDNDVSHFELTIETGIYATYNFKALNGNHDGLIFTDKGDKTYGSTKYHLYELTFQVEKAKCYFVVYDMGGTRIGMGIVGSNADPYNFPSQSKIDEFMKIATTGKYTGSNSIEERAYSIGKVVEAIGTASEEANTGDYAGEYTDTYVNIMVEEINE